MEEINFPSATFKQLHNLLAYAIRVRAQIK